MGHDARLREAAGGLAMNQGPKDAFGRTLHEGDEVILVTRGPIVFRVAQITPVLDPNAPRGLHHLHLASMATLTVKGGAAHGEFIRVQTAEEAGPSPITMVEARPAPPDPQAES